MDRWVALLKGVNVGGNNRVAMDDLRTWCIGLGFANVRTYIASGNITFEAAGAASDILSTLRDTLVAHSLDVPVVIMGGADLKGRLANCPFPLDAGKQVHGFFCDAPPMVDEGRIIDLANAGEEVEVRGRTVWLYTPNGFGTSDVAKKFDQVVTGADFTARNLNTIQKLVEMLDTSVTS